MMREKEKEEESKEIEREREKQRQQNKVGEGGRESFIQRYSIKGKEKVTRCNIKI